MLKKLYSCNARCGERTLISYNTRLFWMNSERSYAMLWRYPSSTSKYHIGKYADWLEKRGHKKYADVVRLLYNNCRDNKQDVAFYDILDETIYYLTPREFNYWARELENM